MITLRPGKTAVLFLLIICAGLLASPASAARIPVSASGDGHVTCAIDNWGTNYTVVTTGAYLSCALYWQSMPEWIDERYTHGIVEIPISSLRGMNLTGASVTFNYYALSYAAYYGVYGGRIEGDGAVTQGDYARSNNPSNVGLYQDYGFGDSGWQALDVASYIQAQLASGYSWASFYFLPGYDISASFAAAEDSQGRGAYLEVTPIPEPSGLLALFAGVSGLGGMIIRRKR